MRSEMKLSTLTAEDMCKIRDAVDSVAGRKAQGEKCTIEVSLAYKGSAKIYHMGASNPVIRVDIKEGK